MPLNLTKIYNQLLDIIGMDESTRKRSLKGIFHRDFVANQQYFKGKSILPTPINGEISMDTLYTHLTTEMVDKVTRRREFEMKRSQRLHWVQFHLNERKKDKTLLFSVKEPDGMRTYYYDIEEKYVLVLEPYRDGKSYYLLSAYYVRGKDGKRNKIEKKYNRRLPVVL